MDFITSITTGITGILIALITTFIAIVVTLYFAKITSSRAYREAELRYSMRKQLEETHSVQIKLQEILKEKDAEILQLRNKITELEKVLSENEGKSQYLQDVINSNFVELRNNIAHSQSVNDELLKFLIKFSKINPTDNKIIDNNKEES